MEDAAEILTRLDKAMNALFQSKQATKPEKRDPLTETDLRDISEVLRRHGRVSWSRIPRIYVVLRNIGQLAAIDVFVSGRITDLSFPFTQKTLPEGLKSQAARCDFLEAQTIVLTKALDMERAGGKHRHIADAAETPFEKLEELGKGAHGYVDRVRSAISHREYARKLLPRGRTFRKDQVVLRDFENELGTLKKLSHIHIVDFIGSYTDPKFVGIIMSPVADCNLKEFLEVHPLPKEERSFLRTFFGCLAAALSYLHENRVRHKDIKPQNVLVKAHHVYLTDFGLSLDWSEHNQSMTTGPASKTPRYCAPEVAADEPRKSSADIWSLGCVFLEIWTVLCGFQMSELNTHMTTTGSNLSSYHSNVPAISVWSQNLQTISGPDAENPYIWISQMLVPKSGDRCTAQSLFAIIQDISLDPSTPFSFTGLCCAEDEDDAESVLSSVFDPSDLATGRSSGRRPALAEPHEIPQPSDSPSFTLLTPILSHTVSPDQVQGTVSASPQRAIQSEHVIPNSSSQINLSGWAKESIPNTQQQSLQSKSNLKGRITDVDDIDDQALVTNEDLPADSLPYMERSENFLSKSHGVYKAADVNISYWDPDHPYGSIERSTTPDLPLYRRQIRHSTDKNGSQSGTDFNTAAEKHLERSDDDGRYGNAIDPVPDAIKYKSSVENQHTVLGQSESWPLRQTEKVNQHTNDRDSSAEPSNSLPDCLGNPLSGVVSLDQMEGRKGTICFLPSCNPGEIEDALFAQNYFDDWYRIRVPKMLLNIRPIRSSLCRGGQFLMCPWQKHSPDPLLWDHILRVLNWLRIAWNVNLEGLECRYPYKIVRGLPLFLSYYPTKIDKAMRKEQSSVLRWWHACEKRQNTSSNAEIVIQIRQVKKSKTNKYHITMVREGGWPHRSEYVFFEAIRHNLACLVPGKTVSSG